MDSRTPQSESKPFSKLKPKTPEQQLGYNEFGIGNSLQGKNIKSLLDLITRRLITRNTPITLKARGKMISKALSFVDIAQRRIKGLGYIQKNYSSIYIKEEDNKEIRLPCLNITLVLQEPQDKTGYYPPKKEDELERNYVDPLMVRRNRARRGFSRGGFRPGFRGGRGRGRGNFWGNRSFDRRYDDYNNGYGRYYRAERFDTGSRYNYNQRYQRNQGYRGINNGYYEGRKYSNRGIPRRGRGNGLRGGNVRRRERN